MRNVVIKSVRVAVGFTALYVCIWSGFVHVSATLDSGWLNTNDPLLQKTSDMPANQIPKPGNLDCTTTTYLKPDKTNAVGCFVATGQGMIGVNGTPILVGANGYPLNTQQSNSYILPIPNQKITALVTNEPAFGSYLHTYSDLWPDLTPIYKGLPPFRQLTSYDIAAAPTGEVRDPRNGNLLPLSLSFTAAFSTDGKWLIADAPNYSFVRIDTTTSEVMPFAATMSRPGDYSDHVVATAISNDGRYAAVYSYEQQSLKIYDLASCTAGQVDYAHPPNCRSRDYVTPIQRLIPDFKSVFSLRFTNDDNVALTVSHDWHSSTDFKVALYRMTAPGKTPRGIDYLALGDSYISGQGEFIYEDGTDTATNACHVSSRAYPFTIGSQRFDSYNSVACSGARTKDIVANGSADYDTSLGGRQSTGKENAGFDTQILTGFLPGYRLQQQFIETYQPAVVTLSIGGNDIGFSKILESCVAPRFDVPTPASTCFDSYDDRLRLVRTVDSLFPRLQQTYRTIMQADPGVKLYVIGYPQIAAEGNCALNVHLNGAEVIFSNHLISYLDWVVERAASSVGARYVDTQPALAGHRLCEGDSRGAAVNGLTAGNDYGLLGLKVFGAESYHPNIAGHDMLAKYILNNTDGLTSAMPAADSNIDSPTPDDQLAQLLLNNYVVVPGEPQVMTDDESLSSDVVSRSVTLNVVADGRSDGLQPGTSYQISLGSGTSNTVLASGMSQDDGTVHAGLTIPTKLPPGPQTLHVTGTSLAGQTIDIFKIIYIVINSNDYTGDSSPPTSCLAALRTGQDSDGDGIDDGCDPLIGDTPSLTYTTRVKLTGNSVIGERPD